MATSSTESRGPEPRRRLGSNHGDTGRPGADGRGGDGGLGAGGCVRDVCSGVTSCACRSARRYRPALWKRCRKPCAPAPPSELQVGDAEPGGQSTSRSYDQKWTPARWFWTTKLATVLTSVSLNTLLCTSLPPIIGVTSI